MAEDKNSYHRQILDKDENARRFRAFVSNLKTIQRLNAQNKHAHFGITKFTDWTTEEEKAFSTPLLRDDVRALRGPSDWARIKWDGSPLPKSFDWRDYGGVTPIKSQANKCNSCWAFAVTAVVESLYKIRKSEIISLSEQEIIDCDSSNDGCTSGSTRRAMLRGKYHGFTHLSEYPHDATNKSWSTCPYHGEIKVNQLYVVNPDANSIAYFIVHYGPVALNVAIPKPYKYYRRGILTNSRECQYMAPNHAVEAVGFGEENGLKYWILKNSWGGWWGERGYFRMERGINACHIESFATSAGVQ
uniref:Cysteine proteinase n=1 Tax=Syphacia muris TaxID=451379 RepID=A0A158R5R2_9BILA